METRFSPRDLAIARVNAVRFANKHPDLAGFHAARFSALTRAFGIPEPAVVSDFGSGPLESLATACIRVLVELKSPFSSFVEAPSSIADLHARYDAAIDEGIRQTEQAIEDLLVATVTDLHDLPADLIVNAEDLRGQGFDPSLPWPDELDYF